MSLQKGCVLHMSLDQESYNPATRRFTDKSAYGNHGIGANAAVFAGDRRGQVNRAEVFDGVADYVDCGDLGFADNSFTMSAWWNQTSLSSDSSSIVSTLRGDTPSMGVGFAPIRNQYIRIYYGRPATDYTYDTVSQVYNLGEWYHTMLTYDGTTIKTYFDNQEIDSRNLNIPKSVLSFIGRWGDHDGFYFEGNIADVWIHNRALTESERTLVYESYRSRMVV